MPPDARARRPLTAEQRRARRERRRRELRRRRLTAAAALVALVVMSVAALAGAAFDGPGAAAPPDRAPQADTVVADDVVLPIATPPGGPVDIAATGDIVMGAEGYGLPPDGGRSFFDPVAHLVSGDVVIGNLEGTLATAGASKCGGRAGANCFAFRTPPSYAAHLRRAGFTVMNLANNHAMDYGASAQDETVAALADADLLDTGRPGTMAVQDVGGTRVAVLGFASYPWADPLLDIEAARRRVRAAGALAHLVVVTFHGGAEGKDHVHVRPGPEEYLGEQRGDLTTFAHAVVEEGADLVVGHGPHVLRGMEIHRGRLIAYSLGNFAGYEVFNLNPATATSAMLQVRLGPGGELRSARIRPTRLVGKGAPAPGGDGIRRIRALSRQDFGARAPVIADDGAVRPPAR